LGPTCINGRIVDELEEQVRQVDRHRDGQAARHSLGDALTHRMMSVTAAADAAAECGGNEIEDWRRRLGVYQSIIARTHPSLHGKQVSKQASK